eukprot:TRINITY_DN7182_c0_g1_i1.p1 TRINITY_DN7182_c0_g1~~TRINITY_DN7182_c0_g1_i1.p1  ORF type:complete len:345 (-),score=89.54 TRINITY_DN7182_c0_g1_i1:35-1069(-)
MQYLQQNMKKVTIRDIDVAYCTIGSVDLEPLFLFNSWNSQMMLYSDFVEELLKLTKDYQLILWDYPGHGNSDDFIVETSLNAHCFARFWLHLYRHLLVSNEIGTFPVHFYAQDMGVMIAAAVFYDYHDIIPIESMIVFSPEGLSVDHPTERSAILPTFWSFLPCKCGGTRERVLEKLTEKYSNEVVDRFQVQFDLILTQRNLRVYFRTLRNILENFDWNGFEEKYKLCAGNCPRVKLILAKEQFDLMKRHYRHSFKQSKNIPILNSSIYAYIEEPEMLAKEVVEALNSELEYHNGIDAHAEMTRSPSAKKIEKENELSKSKEFMEEKLEEQSENNSNTDIEISI